MINITQLYDNIITNNLKLKTIWFDWNYDTEPDYAGGRLQVGGQDYYDIKENDKVTFNSGFIEVENDKKLELFAIENIRRITFDKEGE